MRPWRRNWPMPCRRAPPWPWPDDPTLGPAPATRRQASVPPRSGAGVAARGAGPAAAARHAHRGRLERRPGTRGHRRPAGPRPARGGARGLAGAGAGHGGGDVADRAGEAPHRIPAPVGAAAPGAVRDRGPVQFVAGYARSASRIHAIVGTPDARRISTSRSRRSRETLRFLYSPTNATVGGAARPGPAGVGMPNSSPWRCCATGIRCPPVGDHPAPAGRDKDRARPDS